MGRVLRFLLVLLLIGGAGLVGYALLADLPAPERSVTRSLALPDDG